MRLIAIDLGDADPELVADRCWQAGAAGIWERDDALRVGVEDEVLADFLAAVTDLDPAEVTEVEAVELAGQAVTVPMQGRDVELWVPPTVFGDGSHPTTTTCLELLDGLVAPGDDVLDVGCGSGALAIAAALAGGVVTAIDIDEAAVQATHDNAVRNDVALTVSSTPLADIVADFDVVIANLTAGAVSPLLGDLRRRTRPGGHLIVSGLLHDQWPDVRDELGGDVVDEREADGWLTALLHMP
ncbi:MAG: 50S ribosomal protein L11 methyltransferase [Acidimicrobiales bacterium]|nr:50S ribosomal protein L11 methyltransferase [Acidimicrobiales bacterium]